MGNKPKNLSSEVAQSLRPAQRTNSITRCFIAMRKNGLTFSARRASGVILPMIAALLLLAAAPRVGRAQTCPDASWNGPLSYDTTLSSGCTIEIWYCWKMVGTTLETFVEEIDPQNDLCDGVDPQTWICEGAELILSDVRLRSHIPACPVLAEDYISFAESCWEYHFRPAGGPQYIPCCSEGTCTETATICWNSLTGLYISTHRWNSSGSCTCATPPKPPIAWIDGTCYAVTCGFCAP